MSEMNEDQKRLAETINGMVVADAGPGTGKTFTVVRRYMNIVESGVDPSHILMITFTRNGAQEMSERITNALFERANLATEREEKDKYLNYVKNVRTSTFDAFCLRIVMNSPDIISDFFGIKETLSRNVRLSENETLNRQFFERFYTEFVANPEIVKRYGEGEKNILACLSGRENEIYKLLGNLMCRGIIPYHKGWFDNGERIITGSPNFIRKKLKDDEKAFVTKVKKILKDKKEYNLPPNFATVDPSLVDEAVDEERTTFIDFIHDVFFGYIRKSISENRLTFGLAAIFAFAALYSDEKTRNMNRVDYLMIDEFQDTNELQVLISLLILNKPNICVVGDWKQSIYGFRFANMENIVRFDERVDLFITKLRRGDESRVPFKMQKVEKIPLRKNYRSSETVLMVSFDTFNIETVRPEGEIVELVPNRKEEIGEHTDFELVQADSKENEVRFIVSKILEYINDPKYVIVENGQERRPCFKDIAVLCRTAKTGIQVLEECTNRGVPAFYQGELEIMSTREGKLALAWLRYINNVADSRGIVAILADCGYSLAEIRSFRDENKRWNPPENIRKRRDFLRGKRRRPNDLLTAIFRPYKSLDPDIVQSIINILSSAYDGTLATISDLIRLIENDIENCTRFDIDQTLKTEAVTIQTLHKSKGLEYPIVIIGAINSGSFPNNKSDNSAMGFDENLGLRMRKELAYGIIDGKEQANVCKSWRWGILSNVFKKDPLEEIRLFFVGLTRAKQYITLTAAEKPSKYFTHYRDTYKMTVRSDLDVSTKYDRKAAQQQFLVPDVTGVKKISSNISVHDVMNTFSAIIEGEPYPDNNTKGKGPEYGEKIHKLAYLIGKGIEPAEDYPDLENVRKVIKGLEGSEKRLEVKCAYPINDKYVIRGVIDVLAVFDDHIEIHDYKTDVNKRFLKSYLAQLSIYYHSVKEFYNDSRPIECYIDFVSPDYDESLGPRAHRVEVMSLDELRKAVDDYEDRIKAEKDQIVTNRTIFAEKRNN